MTRRLPQFLAAAAVVLAMPAAHAFTIDDGTDKSGKPKFDLEEQARNFRAPSLDLSTPGARSVETPVGKFHFSTGTNSRPFGFDSAARDRRHYERMFAPDFEKDRY